MSSWGSATWGSATWGGDSATWGWATWSAGTWGSSTRRTISWVSSYTVSTPTITRVTASWDTSYSVSASITRSTIAWASSYSLAGRNRITWASYYKVAASGEAVFTKTPRIPGAKSDWRFVLADSNTLQPIGELTKATGKQLDIVMNRAGGFRYTTDIENELAFKTNVLETCVIAYRESFDGQMLERWSGPVWTIEENLPDGKMNVGCVGWFEELNVARVLRTDQSYTAINNNGGPWTASQIAQNLLAIANNQTDTTNVIRPTKIEWGGFTNTGQIGDQTRQKAWNKGTKIGPCIQELSDIEAGFDMHVRISNGKPRLFITDRMGQNRPEVIFGYNFGPHNLATISRSIDGSKTVNRMQAQGKFGSALAENQDLDETGQRFTQRFGIWEEWTQLPEVAETKILLAYANAEVILRHRPQVTYQINPFPYNANQFVPRIFEDYDLGDIVYVSANKGRFKVDKQAMRVFGASILIDDEGNEKISSLQTTPA